MDVDLTEARRRIDDLVRANLLEPAGDDRYRMHDLLRPMHGRKRTATTRSTRTRR